VREIRVFHLGSPDDVPEDVADRLGLKPGQAITARMRMEIVSARAEALFGRRDRAPSAVAKRGGFYALLNRIRGR
jgi:hypothetical protein